MPVIYYTEQEVNTMLDNLFNAFHKRLSSMIINDGSSYTSGVYAAKNEITHMYYNTDLLQRCKSKL